MSPLSDSVMCAVHFLLISSPIRITYVSGQAGCDCDVAPELLTLTYDE